MGWFSGRRRQRQQEAEIARLREHKAQLQTRVAALEAENARLPIWNEPAGMRAMPAGGLKAMSRLVLTLLAAGI